MNCFPRLCALLLGGLVALSGCAGESKPAYCKMGIVERGIYSNPNPLSGVFISWVMELGCMDLVFRPVDFTCAQINYPDLIFADERLDLGNFTVVSPAEGEWCVDRTYPDRISYFSHPWLGETIEERPDPRQYANTLVMAAVPMTISEEHFGAARDLGTFVEHWIRSGFGVQRRRSDIVVSTLHSEQRFDVSDIFVFDDSGRGKDCVRYEYRTRERNNSLLPDHILELHDVGRICRNPVHHNTLVVVSLSERYAQGFQVDPELFERLRWGFAEAFMRSLEFADHD